MTILGYNNGYEIDKGLPSVIKAFVYSNVL